MLETIKETIEDLPSENFGEFYQSYVSRSEDAIIEHDIKLASSDFKSIEDITELIKGLNKITEELNK